MNIAAAANGWRTELTDTQAPGAPAPAFNATIRARTDTHTMQWTFALIIFSTRALHYGP